jgi:hypothetical protein
MATVAHVRDLLLLSQPETEGGGKELLTDFQASIRSKLTCIR